MEDKVTSVKVKRSTLEALRQYEIHPRETHEEIIIRLIEGGKRDG